MTTALPWSETELRQHQVKVLTYIQEMTEGVRLGLPGSRQSSSPDWKISKRRALEMSKDALCWEPKEGVLPDHRAEAISIVYKGLVKAGMCPRSALRPRRSRYRG